MEIKLVSLSMTERLGSGMQWMSSDPDHSYAVVFFRPLQKIFIDCNSGRSIFNLQPQRTIVSKLFQHHKRVCRIPSLNQKVTTSTAEPLSWMVSSQRRHLQPISRLKRQTISRTYVKPQEMFPIVVYSLLIHAQIEKQFAVKGMRIPAHPPIPFTPPLTPPSSCPTHVHILGHSREGPRIHTEIDKDG